MREIILNEEESFWRDRVREFARSPEVLAIAKRIDKTDEFPWDFIRLAAEKGYLALEMEGADPLWVAILIEEFAYVSKALALILLVHLSLAQYPIYKFGADWQKEKYLPRLAEGKVTGCFMLTDRGGGDAVWLQLSAAEKSDHYVINGQKQFISMASTAFESGGVGIVLARTKKDVQGKDGISAFLIDFKEAEGFKAEHFESFKKEALFGVPLNIVRFENVRVPKECLLAGPEQGWTVVVDGTFKHSRPLIGAEAAGHARRTADAAYCWAQTTKRFDVPLIQLHEINPKFDHPVKTLAKMKRRAEKARYYVYRAMIAERENDKKHKLYSALAKRWAAEWAIQNAVNCQEIHGGMGLVAEGLTTPGFILEGYRCVRWVSEALYSQTYEGAVGALTAVERSERRKLEKEK